MRKHNKLIQINAICQTSNDYKLFHVVQIEMEQFIRSWAFILLSINHIYWLLIHSYRWIIPNTTGIILRGIFKVFNTSCSHQFFRSKGTNFALSMCEEKWHERNEEKRKWHEWKIVTTWTRMSHSPTCKISSLW